MKKLVLHIGMHKTGTSALQTSFFRGKDELARHGLHYFDYSANHSAPFFSLFSQFPEKYHVNRRHGITTPEAAHQHNEHLEKDLRARLAQMPEGTTIISGEDLSLLQKPQLPKLKAFLDDYFDSITVIGYARPPVSFINAYAVQALKGGKPLSAIDVATLAPSYQWRFKKYIDLFGTENVCLKPYHPALLHKNCIVADFLETLDASVGLYEALTVKRVNQHLSMKAAKLLDFENRKNMVSGSENHHTAASRKFLSALGSVPGPRFSMPASSLNDLLTKEAWDIGWMKRHFTTEADTSVWDDSHKLLSPDSEASMRLSDEELEAEAARLMEKTGA